MYALRGGARNMDYQNMQLKIVTGGCIVTGIAFGIFALIAIGGPC